MKQILTTAFVLSFAATSADAFFLPLGEGESGGSAPAVKHTRPMDYSMPAASFQGQHFTNQYGCTYSRTQAPGYPVVWILQVNTRNNGCPNSVGG